MVRVVNFHDEVRDGELELVRPQPPCFVLRREAEARSKIKQNVRGLRDEALAVFQSRRRPLPARAARTRLAPGSRTSSKARSAWCTSADTLLRRAPIGASGLTPIALVWHQAGD